jgi:nicotinate phosphoribosyltransferase
VDPRVAEGYYTDEYFNRTRAVLLADGHHPTVRWQVFQKRAATLCGIDEALGIMRTALGDDWSSLAVYALHDGDKIEPFETVLLVEGDLALFIHLETVVLGALSRRTRVATNVYRTVRAACSVTPKPVLFFPARFDIYQAQAGDGYAYDVAVRRIVAEGNEGVSTQAQGEWWGSRAIGTIPHALEAAYGGDVAAATLAFARRVDPEVRRVALVDYDNDSVRTTLEVADAMLREYLATGDERYRLYAVRLDTSETMVDLSVVPQMGQFRPTGVNPALVRNVHEALQKRAHAHPEGSRERSFYSGIGIIVSGGFTPEKIAEFERQQLPVIAYGVGSSMFAGQFDFTADIVGVEVEGAWRDEAKAGRAYRPNPRLERVE